MALERVAEHVERALDESAGAVWVVAGASAANLGGPAQHALALAGSSNPVSHRHHRVGDRPQAVSARPALASGLRGQVLHHAGALVQPARALTERDQDAGAERATDRMEVLAREAETECSRGIDPGAEVAADEQRLERFRGAAGGFQQVEHRGPESQLVDAGIGDRAGDRYQCRSRVSRGPQLPVPARPVPGHERDLSQRLRVLDQRRVSPVAALEREGRHQCRLGHAAVQIVHDGALFARHVSLGPGGERELRAIRTRADRVVQGIDGRDGAVADLDDDLTRAHGRRGQHGAIEHQMGQTGQQQKVLRARGLGLAAVHDHELASPSRLGDRAELDRGGEVGATAAAQAAPVDGVDQLERREPRHRAVHAQVAVHRHHVAVRVETCQQPRQRGRSLPGKPRRRGSAAHDTASVACRFPVTESDCW